MASGAGAPPRVIIVGGGGTGIAVLHDLALQGVSALLLERGELTSGTTGRHHGQLHSGARYAVGDPHIAAECMEETLALRAIAPESLEYNGGLFVAIGADDEAFLPLFLDACREAAIPHRSVTRDEALGMEPALGPAVRRAVLVPDGTIDAWRLPLQFAATALSNGGEIRTFFRVERIVTSGGRVSGVEGSDLAAPRREEIPAELVVNACGAWAGQTAALAGAHIDVRPSPGAMVAARGRLVNMVVSRLHPASDGDILVPQRGLSIIGSTQRLTDDPEDADVTDEEIAFLRASAARMVPAFAQAPVHAAWAASRPLAGGTGGASTSAAGAGPGHAAAARGLSRDFAVIDHAAEGTHGLISVIGGKATVLRAMAERTVDLVLDRLGERRRASTREVRLLGHRRYHELRAARTQAGG